MSYAPPWLLLMFLLGCLPGVFALVFWSRSFVYGLPVCQACDQRWTSARRWWLLAFVLPVLVGVFGVLGASALNIDALVVAMWCVLLFVPFLAGGIVHYALLRPRTVFMVGASAHAAHLRGICPAVRETIRAAFP